MSEEGSSVDEDPYSFTGNFPISLLFQFGIFIKCLPGFAQKTIKNI